MHDLTFAKEIIDALNNRAKTLNGFYEITIVKAALSPMSHVKPETLKETFASLVKGTPFEHISLRVKTLQLGVRCESCKNEFMIDRPTVSCPECRGSNINIIYSKEFTVEAIEVKKKPSKSA
jgi:hydrogenase nickel insertion protein HypA